jgi:IclR family mhp operon transcriptional activator
MPDEDDVLIRAVMRALGVLQLMNTKQRWTIRELRERTTLPKSTLFRILATLQHEGYVQSDPARGQYALTAKVRQLSGGYTEQSRVVDASSALALRVTREIKWPLAIGVREGEWMVVAHSTMPYSPLAAHSTTIGHHLSLTDSAMGQAYLAYCSAAERNSLLNLFELSLGEDRPTRMVELRGTLSQVRHAGYAVRRPGPASSTATLAVPILHEDEAVATLGMTVFGNLMSQRLVDQYLPTLQQTAREMAALYEGSLAEEAARRPLDFQSTLSGTGTL